MLLLAAQDALATQCPPAHGIALQVLGSGGPIADDNRASSAYLLWVDGRSRVLVDSGGGMFLRFAEADAAFEDLDFVGLSHFHADHSSDFPALLKNGYFSKRDRALLVAGPDGGGPFPGLIRFLDSLLKKDTGAFGYLGGYLDGSGGLSRLVPVQVSSSNSKSTTVFGGKNTDLQIDALHVPHGIVPALAFRIRVENQTIVLASDQNGSKAEFVDFAEDANILVMHMPIPEDATGVARKLHAPPSVIGELAHSAGVKLLVLSHIMERSARNLDQQLATVESRFGGPVEIANDLDCYFLEERE